MNLYYEETISYKTYYSDIFQSKYSLDYFGMYNMFKFFIT